MVAQVTTTDAAAIRIAVVDDDPEERARLAYDLEDCDFKPVVIEGQFGPHIENLVGKILDTNVMACLCDHRLNPRGMAQFEGAAVVAHLIGRKIPAVLITQYANQDNDVSIRKWRSQIPVVVDREHFSADRLREYLGMCQREIEGKRSPTRISHRSIIQIEGITQRGSEEVVEAIIPQWRAHEVVTFPASTVPTALYPQLRERKILLAHVNTGASSQEELFLERFEQAPEPARDENLL